MSKIAEIIFNKSPLLWSPGELNEVVGFFREHRAALALFRRDSTVKKRLSTRKANAKGKQPSIELAAPRVKVKKTNKPKKGKAKLLDALDLDALIANAKGAKA